MSLKLIRRAQIATTKHPEILVAEHVRDILNKIRVSESDEPSMEITRDDYKRWMDTVLDIARERGITITKKSQLAEIAIDVLDNDPKVESQPGNKETLKMQLIATMWNAHAATVGHGRVQSTVKKAREEEEESGFTQNFKAAQGVEDEQVSSPLLKSAVGDGQKNPYMKGTLRFDLWNRMNQSAQENEEDSELPPPDRAHDDAQDDIQDDGQGDVDAGEDDQSSEDYDDSVDNDADAPVEGSEDFGDDDLENDVEGDDHSEDILADISTEELEAELARRNDGDEDDSDGDDETDDDQVEAPTGEDMDADSAEPPADDRPVSKRTPADASADIDLDKGDDESPDDIAARIAHEEEEQDASTSNFFRKVVTAPVEHFKKAVADVESEGQKAWYQVRMPKNPHPKGSHAHKAWTKGFEREAKASLGFKEKPVSTSKQQKKKR